MIIVFLSLQHVVDPMKEEKVHLDQSLTVWIVEAKHLPKKRYEAHFYILSICRHTSLIKLGRDTLSP